MATILRATDAQVVTANPSYFTGTVFQAVLASGQTGVQLVRVTFAPKARTAWHTHPLGQILHIESGQCLFQSEGEPPQTLSVGDTIVIPAGQKHWHGSSPQTVMTHLAIQGIKDGIAADWLEQVTDEQYLLASS